MTKLSLFLICEICESWFGMINFVYFEKLTLSVFITKWNHFVTISGSDSVKLTTQATYNVRLYFVLLVFSKFSDSNNDVSNCCCAFRSWRACLNANRMNSLHFVYVVNRKKNEFRLKNASLIDHDSLAQLKSYTLKLDIRLMESD